MTKSFTFAIFLLGILTAQIACEGPTEDEPSYSETSNAQATEGNSASPETSDSQSQATEDNPAPPETSSALIEDNPSPSETSDSQSQATEDNPAPPETSSALTEDKPSPSETSNAPPTENNSSPSETSNIQPTENKSAPSETSNAPPTENNSSPSETSNVQPTENKSAPSEPSNAPTDTTDTRNKEPNSAPATPERPKTDDIDPWILPGFDKTNISRLGRNNKKCWKNYKYRVCLDKCVYKTELYWKNKKSNALVQIVKFNETEEIVQNWEYQNVEVQLNLKVDGSSEQQWKFGSSDILEVNRNSDGTSKAEWFGSEHPEELEKFKKFIDSWCEYNDFFVGKENCAIYDKTNDNNDPAWILIGFDKNQVSRLNKNGSKCWRNAKYYVCFTENRLGKVLYWKSKKSNATVQMNISSDDGRISQKWAYKDGNIEIRRHEDGSVTQAWKLGSSKFEINKNSNEPAESKWYGDENPEALKTYQEFIDAWCQNNDFFVTKEECLIYK